MRGHFLNGYLVRNFTFDGVLEASWIPFGGLSIGVEMYGPAQHFLRLLVDSSGDCQLVQRAGAIGQHTVGPNVTFGVPVVMRVEDGDWYVNGQLICHVHLFDFTIWKAKVAAGNAYSISATGRSFRTPFLGEFSMVGDVKYIPEIEEC